MAIKFYIKIILFLIVYTGKSFVYGQTSTFGWAKSINGVGNDFGKTITVDAFYNVCTIGTFDGASDFDPGSGTFSLTPTGNYPNMFISKLDSAGNFLWAKNFGGGYINGYAVKTDAAGNVYTTGSFQGTIDFDPGVGVFNLTAAGQSDIFVSKLDAAGNYVWAKRIGATGAESASSLAIDATGDIYLSGGFEGIVDFDPGAGLANCSSAGYQDIFVLKLTANGIFVFVKVMGGTLDNYSYAITLDQTGNIYTTGRFQGTVDFDPGPAVANITYAGQNDIFVSKLDAAGNYVWAKSMGGTSYSYGTSIAADNAGNVYFGGSFQGTTDFDSGTAVMNISCVGFYDAFISKLSSAGNFLWAKTFGGSSPDFVNGLSLDPAGNVCTTGCFTGPADFDPGVGVFNLSIYGQFISKLDAQGNFVWAGEIGSDCGNGIATDQLGNIYTTGSYGSTVDFDPGTGVFNLSASGQSNIYILKLKSCTTPAAPIDVSPLNNKIICQNNTSTLQVSSSGIVSWYAGSTATLAIGAGMNYVTPLQSPGIYTVYAEAFSCAKSVSRTAVTYTVEVCTGITQLSEATSFIFEVYPNPGTGLFNIVSGKHVRIIITDALGKELINEPFPAGNNTIDLKPFEHGIYFLKALSHANETVYRQKIVKWSGPE